MDMEQESIMQAGRLRQLALAVVLATLLAVVWRGQHLYAAELGAPVAQAEPAHDGPGDDGGDKVYGLVEDRPTEVVTGTWVIAGVAYTVTESTVLSTENGALEVGACVEVEVSEGDPTVATQISSEDMTKCTGDPGDGGDDGGDGETKVYGLLEDRPTDVVTGTWIIDGMAYTVTESTVLSTENGSLEVGACVEVEVSEGDPTVATQISTEDMSKCTGQPGDDDDHEDDYIKKYGVIEVRPEGVLTGTWVISGVTYTATESTEFETDYGGFMPEQCVKTVVLSSEPTVLVRLSTVEPYKCGGQHEDDHSDHRDKFFGRVEALPEDGLIGLWVIGGKSISVTEETKLFAKIPFTVGVTVKVEFNTTMSDTMVASQINLIYGIYRRDHHPDGHFGDHDGNEGQAYGIVESRPLSDVVGVWVIGGIPYSVTEQTNFDDGVIPSVDDMVKVKYFVQDDGGRLAFKIEAEDGQGGLDDHNLSKLVGIVDSKPISGFVGSWVIAGADFEADLTTRFQERYVLLAEGAYVEVLYVIQDNARHIISIEAHVPPGAGDHDCLGKVEALSRSGVAVTAESPTAIVVDGVSYTVTSATQIVDDDGTVAVGATVAINSYTSDTGENVATRVSSVTLDNTLVLPFTQR